MKVTVGSKQQVKSALPKVDEAGFLEMFTTFKDSVSSQPVLKKLLSNAPSAVTTQPNGQLFLFVQTPGNTGGAHLNFGYSRTRGLSASFDDMEQSGVLVSAFAPAVGKLAQDLLRLIKADAKDESKKCEKLIADAEEKLKALEAYK